ncbi:unnamed protein product [Hydatigera taeniaeformis]|uniref:CPSF73-100_C domain-containing protein n=1 Tax=Hydatigena taeniaeformis TaxID=6205 RepID=A0A0R3WYI6_HYDTA|nr:unnamed protein product [Hydatigera taeniaeformis]
MTIATNVKATDYCDGPAVSGVRYNQAPLATLASDGHPCKGALKVASDSRLDSTPLVGDIVGLEVHPPISTVSRMSVADQLAGVKHTLDRCIDEALQTDGQ